MTTFTLTPGHAALTHWRVVLDGAAITLAPDSHAAKALGLADEIGTLEAGKACDLAIWDIERPAELAYRIGFNPLHARIWNGQ